MRSLFVKLFLSFVIITLLASFTTGMVSYFAQIGPYGELKKRVQHHQLRALTHSLEITSIAALQILENEGTEGLSRYLQEVEKLSSNKIFLLQSDNSTLSGRSLPPQINHLIETTRQSKSLQHDLTAGQVIVAQPLVSNKGEPFLIIVGTTSKTLPPPHLGGNRRDKPIVHRPLLRRPFGLPILILILIAAGGCYLLARSLTAPIRRLRTATQQISKGDFSARIDLLGAQGDEIADLSRDFNGMAERIQSLLQSQKRLLRDISHELRSPLTRQNVALELARQKFSDAEPFLARIEKESHRLNELIDKLLILTKLEGNAENFPKEPVNLQQLLTTIISDADFEASNSRRRIEIHKNDETTLLGSPEMLSRAFENVIRNGLHYTASGSAVEIEVQQKDKQVTVSIQDHGPGVAKEHLEQIFKPFFRVAESRDRNSGGTGVGLAIAKQAILLHGGTIKASTSTQGGLLVEICLPLL